MQIVHCAVRRARAVILERNNYFIAPTMETDATNVCEFIEIMDDT